ncbi:hypothetical protein ABZV31_29205 [Streptomyces sp. NPDC005202]|uniref:hypothetical protein n=1 Tax=Streptomyces sp. NPDC005202 TaxID=3157021 RepID=UPI0033BCFB55
MGDIEATAGGSEPERCPDCGEPVTYDITDTTASGPEGREKQRGAAICTNEECAMYGRYVHPG